MAMDMRLVSPENETRFLVIRLHADKTASSNPPFSVFTIVSKVIIWPVSLS